MIIFIQYLKFYFFESESLQNPTVMIHCPTIIITKGCERVSYCFMPLQFCVWIICGSCITNNMAKAMQFPLWWGHTADTELRSPQLKIESYQRFFFSKSGVFQKIALHVSLTAWKPATKFLPSDQFIQLHFWPVLFKYKVLCVLNGEADIYFWFDDLYFTWYDLSWVGIKYHVTN